MGVIKVDENLRAAVELGRQFDLHAHLEDYIFSDSSDDEDLNFEENIIAITQTPKSQKKTVKNKSRSVKAAIADVDAHLASRKKIGARKARRLENARLLSQLVDESDICQDGSDMLPEIECAFENLFVDEQAMKKWLAFVEADEDEQELMLAELDNADVPCSSLDIIIVEPEDLHTRLGKRRRHKRSHAATAKNCYKNIDAKLRHLLTSQRTPWGVIDQVERTLKETFTNLPDGIYVASGIDAYGRLIHHFVAQYLFLKCHSYTDSTTGNRDMIIENTMGSFNPPPLTLRCFVNSQKPRCKVS